MLSQGYKGEREYRPKSYIPSPVTMRFTGDKLHAALAKRFGRLQVEPRERR